MGMRDNRIWLVGPLSLLHVREEQIGDLKIPLAVGVVRTYFPGGGSLEHRVLLVGRLAMEAVAFHQEGGGEVAVDGWLLSANGRSLVVADNISFVVPASVRKRIRERLREGPQVQMSAEVMAALLSVSGIRPDKE